GLARTDGVFAFTVTAAALMTFRASITGRGWTSCWLLAALATLTKGPLGVVLSAGGLLACFWERHSQHPWPIRGAYLRGIGFFLLITGGWFFLAYLQVGESLVAKMLGQELFSHAVSKAHFPGTLFYQPPL